MRTLGGEGKLTDKLEFAVLIPHEEKPVGAAKPAPTGTIFSIRPEGTPHLFTLHYYLFPKKPEGPFTAFWPNSARHLFGNRDSGTLG